MQLLKLEVNGFKSFADKTEFLFEAGVTAFVGPNGCGKSNVVDAVRWILGEQSAKAVRGTSMQDVIFNGAGSRKPKGYAEASLTVLNNHGVLPTEYTEVCVTRRLYRTGESEYLLNRQPCRLRDIRQLFMDTGVGMHAYSIIEQGKVTRLLQANPKERREVFEEAAGISKYKAQRKQARAKLERVQENLERARMVLGEKESRLRSIRNQAAKAKRWKGYRERLQEVQVLLGLRRYRQAGERREKLRAEMAELESREQEIARQLETAEASLAEMERAAADLEQAYGVKQDTLYKVESRIQAANECIRRNTDLLAEYAEGIAEAESSVQGVEARRRQSNEDLNRARADYEKVREAVQAQTEKVNRQGQRAQEMAAECDRLQDAIESWKTEVVAAMHRSVELRNEINTVLSSREQDTARQDRLSGRRRAIEEDLLELSESGRALRARGEAIDTKLADLRKRLDDTEAARREALGRVASADGDLQTLREREAALRERREVLMDLDAAGEGVAEGVRWLLRPENRLEGVLGMVADLIHVEQEHALAVESALGERAQFLVARTTDVALAALKRLSEQHGGRAGVFALDRLKEPETAVDLNGQPSVIGRACDVAKYAREAERLLRALLGNTWVVDNFEAAMALARDGGQEARLATVQGDLIEPGGAIIGGEAARRTGIISRRSELEALERELDLLAQQIADIEKERGRASERADHLAGETVSLREAVEAGRRDRHEVETDLQDHGRQRARLDDELQVILDEIQEIEETLITFTAREEQVRRDLADSDAMRARLEEEIRSAQERLQTQRGEASQLRDEVDAMRLELAREDQKREGLESQVASLEKIVEDLAAQVAGARSTIEAYERKRRESESEIARSHEELERLGEEQHAVRADLESLRLQRQATQENRREFFDRAQALRGRHDESSRALSELRVKENRENLELQSVEERLRADWNIDIAEIAAEEAPRDAGEHDWAALTSEAEDLQSKIQKMGGVNTDALAEQEELEAEIQWQVEQRDDLEQAERQLRQIIRKINRICRERFQETFEQVRANFQEMYRKLFGGGNADLRLEEDAEDVLEAGIDIVARPPGKQPKAIIQLSGGEQTMTTVALIFAIFKWKPSPFCILDEVDAALDEANIDRFCAIVREFLETSQFVIITHSKRTMGLADTLYGITMMEQGVSSKLSVKVEEAHKYAEAEALAG